MFLECEIKYVLNSKLHSKSCNILESDNSQAVELKMKFKNILFTLSLSALSSGKCCIIFVTSSGKFM